MSIHILNEKIHEILDSITISSEFCSWAIKWIKKEHYDESAQQKAILDNLTKNMKDNQYKLNNLLDLQIGGLVSKEEYSTKKDELKKERENLEREFNSLKARTYDWIELAEKTFNFAKNAKHNFDHGDAECKTSIFRALGTNFLVKDQKLLVELRKPYLILKENHQFVGDQVKTIELKEKLVTTTQSDYLQGLFQTWSGRRDLNSRPYAPKAYVLAI